MKKIIATAAGLMLTGAMVSTAVADIEFGGDSRVRYYYLANYANLMDSDDTHAHSRVRLKMKGTTESGAYAKARLKWNVDPMGGDSAGLKFDYAYLGVPMGDFEFQGGHIPTHVTTMVEDDVDRESFIVSYSDEVNNFSFIYEFAEDDDSPDNEDGYNYIARYEMDNDGVNFVTGVIFSDPAEGDSGVTVAAAFAHDLGGVSYSIDYAFVDDAITGTGNNGHMGYATVSVPTGAAGSVSFIAGMTKDGAMMDAPVGFTMIGGDTAVTPGATANVGAIQEIVIGQEQDEEGNLVDVVGAIPVDTWFAGISASYEVSEKSSIGMTAAYADMEEVDGNADFSAWEVGFNYTYAIAEDVETFVQLGYMDIDEAEDSQFGFAWGLDVSF